MSIAGADSMQSDKIASLTRLVFDKDAEKDTDHVSFKEMVDDAVHHFPKGMMLEEFCVRCDLDESSKSHIDDWLDFAFRSGTTRVELDLLEKFCPGYSIPVELFQDSNHAYRFSVLRQLFLMHADMGNQVFEAIISTCPSLECLVLVDNDQLIKAKCTIPHLKLKHLTMDCRFLESLEIVAPNLVSFSFWYSAFKRTSISIEDARPLVNLNIMSVLNLRGDFVFGQFSEYISRLQCLTLGTTTVLERIMAYGKVPCLHDLTTLSLLHDNCEIPYKRAAICMLEASPLLQRFELHISCRYYDFNLIEGRHDMVPMSRHQGLKKIMFSGFGGGEEEDLDFLRLIVDHTAVLESVEITSSFVDYYQVDKKDGSYIQTFHEDESIRNRDEYIENIRSNLLSMLPSKISLTLFDD